MDKVNVICMKWGTAYSANYVNILYKMVKRNLTLPFRFICLTDDPTGIISEVETAPLPEFYIPTKHQVSPWRKLSLFIDAGLGLKGRTLFLDLDIVIVDNIDCFFTHSEKFCIIENWTQLGRGIGNSSVFCFEYGKYDYVIEEYNRNMEKIYSLYSNEQTYLSRIVAQHEKIHFWPDSWCQSFKRHCLHNFFLVNKFRQPVRPEESKIIVFHGNPKPHNAIAGIWPNKPHKDFHPTYWLRALWC